MVENYQVRPVNIEIKWERFMNKFKQKLHKHIFNCYDQLKMKIMINLSRNREKRYAN